MISNNFFIYNPVGEIYCLWLQAKINFFKQTPCTCDNAETISKYKQILGYMNDHYGMHNTEDAYMFNLFVEELIRNVKAK
jgi:uncharacterized UBP type Zn finger protein